MSSEPFSGYKIKYGVRAKHLPLMNKTTEGLQGACEVGYGGDNKQSYRFRTKHSFLVNNCKHDSNKRNIEVMLQTEEEASEVLHLEHSFIWC